MSEPCTSPIPNARFGRSPTFQIVQTDGTSRVYSDYFCGPFDLVLTDDDRLSTDNQIAHHVLVRLAARRRAQEGDDVDASIALCGDAGGWWADAWREREIGSRLWTLQDKVPNEENRQRATEMANEALQDLVDIGAVASFDLQATYHRQDGITQLDLDPLVANKPTKFESGSNWDWLWEDGA